MILKTEFLMNNTGMILILLQNAMCNQLIIINNKKVTVVTPD